MTTENLFEIASRRQFRFDSKVGQLSVEDLWTLPLTSATKVSLDGIAVELNRQLKGTEESFVVSSTKDQILEQKFEIVKHIIKVRVEEAQAKVEEGKKKETVGRIQALIAQKEDEKLASLSVEELRELAAKL